MKILVEIIYIYLYSLLFYSVTIKIMLLDEALNILRKYNKVDLYYQNSSIIPAEAYFYRYNCEFTKKISQQWKPGKEVSINYVVHHSFYVANTIKFL